MDSPRIESVAPESEKFTAPLVFLHGLWGDPADWRRAMGYFAHRGWHGHAVALPPQQPSAAVADVIASLPAPPILVGHDAGALLALAAHTPPPRAVVAIAPLLPRSGRNLTRRPGREWHQRWAAWRGGPVPTPRNTDAWFGREAPSRHEAPSFLDAIDALDPAPPAVPGLLVVPEHDAVVVPAEQEALAARLGCDVVRIAGGHAVPFAAGWEQCVAVVHRWLVRRLGASLLAWLDEMERGEL